MKGNLVLSLFKGWIILLFCGVSGVSEVSAPTDNPYPFVDSIPVPSGYHRIPQAKNSFGEWLRQVSLKKDRQVRLYDGTLKRNQGAQFAVLNVSVGKKDLQQCADAIMRLRAEYLFAQHDYRHMEFVSMSGVPFRYDEWAGGKRFRQKGDHLRVYMTAAQHPAVRSCFDAWLELVFGYCGTLSLERQLVPSGIGDMQAGDVLIRGGSPGHAMIVMDIAEDAAGHRIYMLAQSYMPAQDIHIVRNPVGAGMDPWYAIQRGWIETPEWEFNSGQLRTWPARS